MSEKVRVSVDGTQPLLYTSLTTIAWRNDGRELYFIGGDGGSIMVAPVETGATFHAGVPHMLCRLPREVIAADVSPDGQTIAAVVPASDSNRSVLNLFMNWSSGLDQSH